MRHRTAIPALLALTALCTITPSTAHADLPHLLLLGQDFNLEAGSVLHLTLGLPAGLEAGDLVDAVVTVASHEAVSTRAGVTEVLGGGPGRQLDAVQLEDDAAALRIDGTWQLEVPTEIDTRTRAALRFPEAALYPISVRVEVGGEPVAELVSIVHRLAVPDDAPSPGAMRVAVVAELRNPVTLGTDGTVERAASATADVQALASLLEASAVPLSVTAEPALLSALSSPTSDDASRAAVGRLGIQLPSHEVLSRPSLPLDPSAAAAAGQRDLYTEWLRDGEDLLATTLSSSPSRSTVLVDAPLSTAGAALLRDLGARLFVLPWQQYTALDGAIGAYTDLTRLVRVDVGDGVSVDAVVVDHGPLTNLTANGSSSTSTVTAIAAVADLLAARQEIVDRDEDPGRHGITLGLPDLGVPSSEGFAEFTGLLAETPGLEPSTVDELGVRTDVQLVGGQPVTVQLPPTVTSDLTARVSTVAQLRLDGRATASMLPSGDARPARWERLTSILPTSALTDEQVATIATALDEEFTAVRGAVQVPSGFGFTLTGRSGTIPVSLYNSSDAPLEVTVQMTSSKLTFPDGPLTVVLEPQTYTEVRIAITARSNGSIPATLLVTTPEGRVPLAPAVPLTAKVNALNGLGNLITGAAGLVLLTWWGRHVRRSRRQRIEAETAASAARHPVHGDRDDTSPPDVATTTLPPS